MAWPILKCSSSTGSKYKSQYSVTKSGPNPALRDGPNDSLLLLEYEAWQGPNPELRSGASVKTDGPEARAGPRPSLARGPTGLANGPAGLAKGSMYQKLSKKTAKIVV